MKQTGNKILGEISITSDVQMTPPLWQRMRETKETFDEIEEESENSGLILNIQKTKIMACSPITSWSIDRERMKTVRHFSFLGSKITADGDCSCEI